MAGALRLPSALPQPLLPREQVFSRRWMRLFQPRDDGQQGQEGLDRPDPARRSTGRDPASAIQRTPLQEKEASQ
jgi:hypothetical protein